MTLKGKTLFITGASRGIGKAIAMRAARDGANIVIAAKTTEPHPKLPGTIFTAATEIQEAGGQALPIQCDIRSEEDVQLAIKKTVETYGGIDIVVNNASAISLTTTEDTSVKKFDLMHGVNARGTWMVSKYAIPFLKESAKRGRNPHILTLSPPLDMSEKWFAQNVAYSMSKYGMSMCVLGLAGELREHGIGVNALWPKTGIDTAAISNVVAPDQLKHTRRPEIMADAAYVMLNQPSTYTGVFAIDESILRSQGISDFNIYKTDPNCGDGELMPDFFVPDNYQFPLPKQNVIAKL